MQISVKSFGETIVHAGRLSIEAGIGDKRMPPWRTVDELLQARNRLRAGNSGGNEVCMDRLHPTRGLISNRLDSFNSNVKNPVRSSSKKGWPEQVFKSFRYEKELQDGHEGIEIKKTCAPENFCSSYEENDNQPLIKDTQMQLNPQRLITEGIHDTTIRAKRNQNICEYRVADSRAKGVPFPKLEDLLVEQTWLDVLPGEPQKPYMKNLSEFVRREAEGRIPIYPPPALVFNALNTCPSDKVNVVILGQDPYHGPGQAMGLCFSVPKGINIPSSLKNIFKEIQQDVGCSLPYHGNLEKWATQGVLLLNTVLTVCKNQANSHAKMGWEQLTGFIICTISARRPAVIFILWGTSAREKIRLIDTSKHYILKAAHPSGHSAHKGFFNCSVVWQAFFGDKKNSATITAAH